MKVLHVIPSMWEGDGGPSFAVRAMERALAAQGVTVETATTDDAGGGARNGKRGPQLEDGLVRHYFARRSRTYKWAPGFARWIAGEAQRYDLLHVHALFSFTSTAAAQAARRAGVPYVLRPLGTLDAWSLANRRPWLKKLSMRLIEAPILRHAAAVHFTSLQEAAEGRATGLPMREAIIPLGIELPASDHRRAPTGDTVRALYLSRLSAKKNVEGLLDAMALAAAAAPRLQLVIAGSGDPVYEQALRRRADALGIGTRVEWLGHVSGESKHRAFHDADFFVLPSHSENFGVAAAEALAHGLPCVLGEGVAISREVASAGAGLRVPTSAEGIAAALAHMIDAKVRAPMSQSALRIARDSYSLEAMGAQLKLLYADICDSRAIPRRR